ncbi:hypothetical protein [Sphingopyxis panaciterrulae]|uniref:Uncharacterized protein n=1 Tax=Sphingopyxis panaciterrulae TaxID=462372 RepID=A0A7W9B257_9SPHN|nr:hypothetical protein [Sphingopyxis panaciterrulae]MBB5704843.1 hypothetical protein [Sphingopyxis panaciterrulae]
MSPVAPLFLLVAQLAASAPDADAVDVEQVQAPSGKCQGSIDQVGAVAPSDPTIQQLPETMELPRDAAAPEADLVRTERPRASLYLEVANAWEVIRRRGQQPTPELIAREIGPDMLARFLNQFPGSEAMFGKDSDRLPVEPPALPPYPDTPK